MNSNGKRSFGRAAANRNRSIGSAYLWNQPDTEQYFDTPDDALEYIVAGDRLRDIITQIDVLSRAF